MCGPPCPRQRKTTAQNDNPQPSLSSAALLSSPHSSSQRFPHHQGAARATRQRQERVSGLPLIPCNEIKAQRRVVRNRSVADGSGVAENTAWVVRSGAGPTRTAAAPSHGQQAAARDGGVETAHEVPSKCLQCSNEAARVGGAAVLRARGQLLDAVPAPMALARPLSIAHHRQEGHGHQEVRRRQCRDGKRAAAPHRRPR